ncbi:MAG: glycosyltransferase [Pseudomonadota bacterium]
MRLVKTSVVRALLMGDRLGQPIHASNQLTVSTFIDEPMGISIAGKLTIDALKRAGFPVQSHGLRPVFSRGGWGRGQLPNAGGGVWLLHGNAPEALTTLMKVRPGYWRHKFRIGYWAYELTPAPKLWRRIAGLFHEVWVPSRFVADSLAGIRPPVRVMCHPVSGFAGVVPQRGRFGIDADFAVLCASDLRSSMARKNIIGAIETYRRAFPETSAAAQLIVKLHRTDQYPKALAKVLEVAGGRSDIRIVSQQLDPEDMRRLIVSCDLVLSPHRSEGFGLLLAEAFMAGRLALATSWSGNMDFMHGLDPLLISARQTAVLDPYGVYQASSNATWAEPDLIEASTKLATIAKETPQWRAQLSAAGRRNLEVLYENWSESELRGQPFARYI